MRCPVCKTKYSDDLLLCPNCGTLTEETRPSRALNLGKPEVDEPDTPEPQEVKSPSKVRRIILWGSILVVLLTISVGGAAYFGLHQGELDREQEREAVADEHYRAGLARLDAAEYELAIAEFKYVLKLQPSHPLAEQGIAEAQARMTAARPTPTTETYEIVAADIYDEALTAYEAEDWEAAVSKITHLRALDRTYRAEEVEDLLFNSLYNGGMQRLEEDRLEEGIFYLDQAISLRPLDENTLNQRDLAVRYMTALGYWGADWDLSIEQFSELYAIAPNYKDVFQRLYQSHINYADAWYAQGEMCPAQEQYAQALQLINSQLIADKRAQTELVCLAATPTPIAPITGTMAITITELPEGFTTGRLAYPIYNTETAVYDIYSLFADGRLLRLATAADQPNWRWGGAALAYRDQANGGLAVWQPGQAEGQVILPGWGYAWPTLSPDGSRIAYAAKDAGGTWHVYIAPVDGSEAGSPHAEGYNPSWGPTGLLAWTGCDGAGACGIMVDNPNDDQLPARLTASDDDIAVSWHPGGTQLLYMSDVTGNWDVYLLNLVGGVSILTEDPGADGLPVWSPDGARIAFVSNRDGLWGIYLMDPGGQNQHKILNLGPNLPNWTSQRLSWVP